MDTRKPDDLHQELLLLWGINDYSPDVRQHFKDALQAHLSKAELRVLFLIPGMEKVALSSILEKGHEAGISAGEIEDTLPVLIRKSVVFGGEGPAGPWYQRSDLIFFIECQLREFEITPMVEACAELACKRRSSLGTSSRRTPSFRVMPTEPSLTTKTAQITITLDAPVPDRREVLPVDAVGKLIDGQSLIAVMTCLCRRGLELMGMGCEHRQEVCLAFGEFARLMLSSSTARRIDTQEALRIVREAEASGFVHFVSNCSDDPQILCNCCPCSCQVLQSMARGHYNLGSPSRYEVAFRPQDCIPCDACVRICPVLAIRRNGEEVETDQEMCIGCGLCVSACPENARFMVLREPTPHIFRDYRSLDRQVRFEMTGRAA